MTNKEKLIDFLKSDDVELIDSITNKLKNDEIQYAVDYVEKLNTISTHRITNIGHTEAGDFFINCETGVTVLK